MFEEEVVYSTRIGMRILNVSDFRDEVHSNSWDHACFVRLYALYLDEKIEFVVHQRKLRDHGVGDGGEFRYEFGGGFAMGRKNRSYDDVNGSSHGRENQKIEVVNVTPVREMEAGRILERLKHLLKILDRILWCTPNGAAKNNKLVLVALYQIVKDSFNIYAELCDVLGVVMDRFTEMEYAQCVKAFNAYVSAAKMFDELAGFYCWCKDIGITRSLEYPEVLKITDKLLGTLKGFLKDNRPKSPNKIIATKVILIAKEPEPEVDMNEVKALPPPENHTTPPPPSVPQPKPVPPTQQVTNDLVNLRDGGVSADEQGNKLALELFSGPAAVRTEGSWEAFPSNGESEVTSVWQTPAAELGKVDWELALAESCSNLSKQEANLAGGFDQLLLNNLYDQGAVRQHVSTNQMSGGSASSVALPGADKSATAVLALPSPDGTVQVVGPQDPFAASLSLPPPSYVQIADMERKQHLFVQEQQLWQQYGRDGMQGQVALARAAGGPGYSALVPQPMMQMMPHGMPQFGGGMGQTGGYYHTPY